MGLGGVGAGFIQRVYPAEIVFDFSSGEFSKSDFGLGDLVAKARLSVMYDGCSRENRVGVSRELFQEGSRFREIFWFAELLGAESDDGIRGQHHGPRMPRSNC